MNAIKTLDGNTPKMPVLFLGHGSPMNAIEENEFVQGYRNISAEIETPRAIVVVSAHWETKGTQVSAVEKPATMYDFVGFPDDLYKIEYPALGMPQLAAAVKGMVSNDAVIMDETRGLDHGAWTVISRMYPKANIPVVELSLDFYKSPMQHYELAKELRSLRYKGVLVVGSGNLVHNLRMVNWQRMNEFYGYDWAIEANDRIKQLILDGNDRDLISYFKLGKAFELSIPTPEHYLPLLYTLALRDSSDSVKLFNDKPVGGSLAMTSIKIG